MVFGNACCLTSDRGRAQNLLVYNVVTNDPTKKDTGRNSLSIHCRSRGGKASIDKPGCHPRDLRLRYLGPLSKVIDGAGASPSFASAFVEEHEIGAEMIAPIV